MMKYLTMFLVVIVLSMFVAANSASAQLAVDWFTFDGGGGVSSGADFEITGTIGQHDASLTMSGGTFSLTGGFWTTASTDILLGDVNLDGSVDLLDVAPFIDAITTGTYIAQADINQDGAVDLLDVEPFVQLLTGG